MARSWPASASQVLPAFLSLSVTLCLNRPFLFLPSRRHFRTRLAFASSDINRPLLIGCALTTSHTPSCLFIGLFSCADRSAPMLPTRLDLSVGDLPETIICRRIYFFLSSSSPPHLGDLGLNLSSSIPPWDSSCHHISSRHPLYDHVTYVMYVLLFILSPRFSSPSLVHLLSSLSSLSTLLGIISFPHPVRRSECFCQ